jgi:hypothetical protein
MPTDFSSGANFSDGEFATVACVTDEPKQLRVIPSYSQEKRAQQKVRNGHGREMRLVAHKDQAKFFESTDPLPKCKPNFERGRR